jgi:hypothetical protein
MNSVGITNLQVFRYSYHRNIYLGRSPCRNIKQMQILLYAPYCPRVAQCGHAGLQVSLYKPTKSLYKAKFSGII